MDALAFKTYYTSFRTIWINIKRLQVSFFVLKKNQFTYPIFSTISIKLLKAFLSKKSSIKLNDLFNFTQPSWQVK